MRAIILAAGRGKRLQQPGAAPPPKSLLRFQGRSLLERHLLLLRACKVEEVVIVVGYEHGQIAAELDRLDWQPRPRLVINEQFLLGSVLSVHVAAHAMIAGGDVLLMDADVLYDRRMMARLTEGAHADRVLLDRGFDGGDEAVKLCIDKGRIVELRKKVADGLAYDTVGESVGFFRLTEATARDFAKRVKHYIDSGRASEPHEETLRDLLIDPRNHFDATDVTGLPWLEIDFPADIERAEYKILPLLHPLEI